MKINVTINFSGDLDEFVDLMIDEEESEDVKENEIDQPCEICGATSDEYCNIEEHLREAINEMNQEKETEQDLRTIFGVFTDDEIDVSDHANKNGQYVSLLNEPDAVLSSAAKSQKLRLLTELSTTLYNEMLGEYQNDMTIVPSSLSNALKAAITRTIKRMFDYYVII